MGRERGILLILRMVGLDKLNEKGSMLIDSLIGLVVLTICGLLIIPTYMAMQHHAQRQLIDLHVSQVLFSGAKMVEQEGIRSGTQMIEQRQYSWRFDDGELCVNVTVQQQEVERCITAMSEDLP